MQRSLPRRDAFWGVTGFLVSTDDTGTSFFSFYPIMPLRTVTTSICLLLLKYCHLLLRCVGVELGKGSTNLEIWRSQGLGDFWTYGRKGEPLKRKRISCWCQMIVGHVGQMSCKTGFSINVALGTDLCLCRGQSHSGRLTKKPQELLYFSLA